MLVIHVKRSCQELAKMFMRFQEFYESPVFRGKIFTRKEYLQWYKETKGTKYEEDWAGFNIPGWVIDVFRHGCFDPLTKQEKELISMCPESCLFYVIGTEADNVKNMHHELAHALFYMDFVYRHNAEHIIKNLPSWRRKSTENKLKKQGYHPSVFIDEMQAYLLTEEPYEDTKSEHEELKILFKTHVDSLFIRDADKYSPYILNMPIVNNFSVTDLSLMEVDPD